MARRVRSLSKRGADVFEKGKKASGRCRRQGVRSGARGERGPQSIVTIEIMSKTLRKSANH